MYILSLSQNISFLAELFHYYVATIRYGLLNMRLKLSSKNPQIQTLSEKCHEFSANKNILCWIPSNKGILGNEIVDQQAKTSLSLEQTSLKIPFSNFKPSFNKYVLDQCQTSWNNSIGNKLLEKKTIISEHQSVFETLGKGFRS